MSVCIKRARALLRCLSQSRVAATNATAAKIPVPTPMPILAPSDKPSSWGTAAAAAADDVAANELVSESGSTIERDDVVFEEVVELEDAESLS